MSLNIEAGLPGQIRALERRLKEMDASKIKPSALKEITDTINNLKTLLKEKLEKKEQRKKDKEQKAQEVEKEAINVPNAADVGAVSQNAPAPAAAPGAPAATPDDQKVSCPLCGGLTFNDNASYQQHMAYTHASDIMPTSPGQKQDNLVASNDPVVDKVETDPKIAPGIIVPDSVKKHDEVVDRVEKDPKVAPSIVSEKEEPKFKLDDEVKPTRGSESTGKVMRWDGKPSDLVYVSWDSGPLADRDGFGGYYPHDLELVTPELVEAAMPMEKPACADCVSMKEKQGDLKTNYEGLLKDLKDERDIHYTQGNSKWVERLDQKIRDLEKSIEEKFPNEKEGEVGKPSRCPKCGGIGAADSKIGTEESFVCTKCKNRWSQYRKEGGAQNDSEGLVIMDHTPPRANSGPDIGGKDTHDEFQDEWAMPAGIELESKLPKAQQKELDSLVQKAVYGYQINIMDMTKVYQAGEAAFIAGQDVTAAVHAFLDSMVAAGKAMKTAAVKAPVTTPTKLLVFKREFLATPLKDQQKFGGYEISQNGKKLFKINSKDSQPMSKEQLEFCAQIELTRGFKQAKLTEKIAFLDAGTKVYILAQDKPGKRIKFASMELGLRGWAPVSKFALLSKEGEMRKHRDHIDNTFGHNGKEMLVDCPNGSGNMVWLPINELLPIQAPPATPESLNPDLGLESAKKELPTKNCIHCGNKFSYDPRYQTEESAKKCQDCFGKENDKWQIEQKKRKEYEKSKKHPKNIDPTFPSGSRFDIEDPLAVPRNINDLEAEKDCPDCHGNFEGAEGATCLTCGRFAIQKEALRPALAPQILNRRQEVNASGCDQCDAAMINGVFCHETGCPNAHKEWEQEQEFGNFLEGSLSKKATVVHRTDGWHVLSEKGKNLGGPYKSKAEAVKRLRQVEYFKHHGSVVRPFSKKADVLTDHVTEVRNNIEQVQQRLQEVPAIKTADATVTETEEETSTGNSLTPIPGVPPLPTVPTITNVQPTDNNNLEIPVPMPTSPPAPGQKWVYNDVDGVYVSMPDNTDPSKIV